MSDQRNLKTVKRGVSAEPMERWAGFIVNTGYEDLPSEVVDHVKKLFLDTLGIMVGGSSQESIPEIVRLVRGWRGRKESTIPVYGGKVPCPNAAFAAGPMARALDMGDIPPQACHISEYVVPALLPAVGLAGNVGGKEFITAYALGAELGSRLGNACQAMEAPYAAGRDPQFGIFEATAAVGKLLGLDKERMLNALGIAYHLMITTDLPMYLENTLMVRVHHGFVCQNAINAVLMAKIGVTGAHKVFTGKGGFFDLIYFWESDYEPLMENLGKIWELLKIAFKLYACCYCSHSSINGALSLVHKNEIDVDNISKISIELDPGSLMTVCEPHDVCWNPRTAIEGQFSLPFAISTALIKKRVFIDDFTPGELQNKDVRTLIQKVEARAKKALAGFESVVTINLTDGKKHTQKTTIDEIRGAFLNPVGWEDVIEKFRSFRSYCAVEIPHENMDKIIDRCKNLETVDNMKDVIDLMTPGDARSNEQ